MSAQTNRLTAGRVELQNLVLVIEGNLVSIQPWLAQYQVVSTGVRHVEFNLLYVVPIRKRNGGGI